MIAVVVRVAVNNCKNNDSSSSNIKVVLLIIVIVPLFNVSSREGKKDRKFNGWLYDVKYVRK